ncbi:UDP-glucuronosyl/UDP-glucosyltransferase [Corchorus capsularis]|uniref:Glycosyltransferase n=1 Tax=Corchorus capsularis TaxID=210143 RepID=A0A1R3H649_COCAP|nr:UDP-glucuronosyl/UDP-glucosyltransferase [Corchorus capsularis]
MAEEESRKNIVMFPFMAHGHLNPFMSLARLLEQRKGYKITIVNTPLNIQKLKSSLPCKTNIQLAEMPFDGTLYGLPPNSENTDKLSYEFIVRLMEASETLEIPFKNLIQNMAKKEFPVCIISDMFLGWTVNVAKELGIFHAVFIAGAAYSMGIYFSLSLNPNQAGTEEEEFSLLDFPEAGKLHHSQLGNDLNFCFPFRERQFLFCFKSDAILLNSIEELEQMDAKYFTRKTGGKPVWMVGPACSMAVTKGLSSDFDEISAWLEVNPRDSVLPPLGFTMTEESQVDEWLPDGFQERINKSNQGILVRQWAPQVEILAHKSTGAFLSHCGWNSVLESLYHGVPIIGWPLAGEQFFNSQLLEKEVGVCVEVARGLQTAVVQQDHVAKTINLVMGKTVKGEEMRRNVSDIQRKMEDAILERDDYKGSSVKAMDDFLRRTEIWAHKNQTIE